MSDKVYSEKAGGHDAEVARVVSERSALAKDADIKGLAALGYQQELKRNRSLFTLLFQSLAIAAIPYGEGAPILSAIYGGGQLSLFVGWIVVCLLDQCVALSISELASRYPTSAGPYYWSYQLAGEKTKTILSFITSWVWFVGCVTITLSVNFGFASLVSALISMFHPDYVSQPWQLLLLFYAICLITLVVAVFANDHLPLVDSCCAAFTLASIIVICIVLPVKAATGRSSASYALGHYDTSLSGWGGFTFFIGLLPPAYTFSAIGMITSMAEEVADPRKKVPWAVSLCVPVGGIAGLFFIIPICVTLPPLDQVILAPAAQGLPYIFQLVTGSKGGGLGLTILVLIITIFCSISITVAGSRATWAVARDHALPFSRFISSVNTRLGVPLNAIVVLTVIQMLLGLIVLGSTTAFYAFVSVGVIALEISYAIPIATSLFSGRKEVDRAEFHLGFFGLLANVISLAWIGFLTVLFSMPTVLPTTEQAMNYAIVVLVGFMAISAVYYIVYARKVYVGPPKTDAIE